MCFIDDGDYDWVAEYQETDKNYSNRLFRLRCAECGVLIDAGESCCRMYLQQWEEPRCAACEMVEGCNCVPSNYDSEEAFQSRFSTGDSETVIWCQECEKFLTAIEAVEEAEGCPAYSRRPRVGGMREELWHLDKADKKKYFLRAKQMFPELVTSGYFARIM